MHACLQARLQASGGPRAWPARKGEDGTRWPPCTRAGSSGDSALSAPLAPLSVAPLSVLPALPLDSLAAAAANGERGWPPPPAAPGAAPAPVAAPGPAGPGPPGPTAPWLVGSASPPATPPSPCAAPSPAPGRSGAGAAAAGPAAAGTPPPLAPSCEGRRGSAALSGRPAEDRTQGNPTAQQVRMHAPGRRAHQLLRQVRGRPQRRNSSHARALHSRGLARAAWAAASEYPEQRVNRRARQPHLQGVPPLVQRVPDPDIRRCVAHALGAACCSGCALGWWRIAGRGRRPAPIRQGRGSLCAARRRGPAGPGGALARRQRPRHQPKRCQGREFGACAGCGRRRRACERPGVRRRRRRGNRRTSRGAGGVIGVRSAVRRQRVRSHARGSHGISGLVSGAVLRRARRARGCGGWSHCSALSTSPSAMPCLARAGQSDSTHRRRPHPPGHSQWSSSRGQSAYTDWGSSRDLCRPMVGLLGGALRPDFHFMQSMHRNPCAKSVQSFIVHMPQMLWLQVWF